MSAAPALDLVAPFRDSTDLLTSADALRERAAEDGYLFFRQLLPRADLESARLKVMGALRQDGILTQGGWRDGVVDRAGVDRIPADEMRLDIGIPISSYVHVQQLPVIHALPHHPAFLRLYLTLLGEEVFVHPRHIVRAMTGHPDLRPTPAHQDFPLIQGTPKTWTAWFPLGACPAEMGPLAVLRRSDRNGCLPIAPAEGAGQLQSILCAGEDSWVSGPFEQGDVLTFPSYTVHRGMPPAQRTRIRVSMDIRFQAVSEPIEARSLSNHADVGWDTIYRGWTDDRLQYYWRADAPQLSPWDDSLVQPGRRIC